MSPTVSKWRRFSAANRAVPDKSLSRAERAGLRRTAAQMLVMAEYCPRYAASMRRSAALFQLIECGDFAEVSGSRRRLSAPETGHTPECGSGLIDLAAQAAATAAPTI